MEICKYCGKEFEKKLSLAAHIGHCKSKPNFINRDYHLSSKKAALKRKLIIENKIAEGDPDYIYKYLKKDIKCICKKCNKEYIIHITQRDFDRDNYSHYCCNSCRNSHILNDEIKSNISNGIKNSIKFQIATQRQKENAKRNKTGRYKTYFCKVCGKQFKFDDIKDVKGLTYCSQKCRLKWYKDNLGGYREGSGRGKQGWYQGIHCDSSWELAFLVYYKDHDLYIERCKEKRKYIWKGKEYTYYPDFITNEGIIEIKGYSTEQWKCKEMQNPDVKVLYKNEMNKYLDYVINKYGNDFIKLYDGYNPKLDIKNQKYVFVHNDKENRMIKVELYDDFINKGYIKGRKKFN